MNRERTVMLLALALGLVVIAAGCADSERPAGPRGDGGPRDAPPVPRPTSTDVPCEVANVLAAQCWTCHGAVPTAMAPSLVTVADLSRRSAVDPRATYAERAVTRMRAATLPMPPVGTRVAEPDIVAFETWIAAGMPAGNCMVEDPFNTPVTCTSGTTWTGGTSESPDMRPGGTCVSCHDREAPERRFFVAGTVYPSAHEPDDCNGGTGGGTATVEITDMEGRVFSLTPNAVGNFMLFRPTSEDLPPGALMAAAFTFPYTARVLFEGRERAMLAAQSSGECNGCHTVAGAEMAPGRVVLP